MADSEAKKQSLFEHLAELRKRLIYAILGLAVGAGVGLYFSERLFRFLMDRLNFILEYPGSFGIIHFSTQSLSNLVTLTQVGIVDLFLVQFNMGVIVGLVLALPWVLYQLALFVMPALSKQERKWLYVLVPGALVMFVVGALFAWYLVLPPTLVFFVHFAQRSDVKLLVGPNHWIDLITHLLVPFGLIFELPLVVGILAKIGVITAEFLRRVRKYAILVIFVLAAVIAPPTVIDQVFLAIPMMALYEVSIWIAKLVRPVRKDDVIE